GDSIGELHVTAIAAVEDAAAERARVERAGRIPHGQHAAVGIDAAALFLSGVGAEGRVDDERRRATVVEDATAAEAVNACARSVVVEGRVRDLKAAAVVGEAAAIKAGRVVTESRVHQLERAAEVEDAAAIVAGCRIV